VTLWFDSRDFRLISLPPVIHVLRDGGLSRADLLKALARRFDVGERHGDAMILSVRDYLEDVQRGHQKVFQLDPDAITATAPWASQLQL
jgi:hypothetical protein